MKIHKLIHAGLAAAFLSGCTSEPLVSRKGISSVALGEVGIEALLLASVVGGGVSSPKHLGNFDTSDTHYIGGIIPVAAEWSGRGRRVDNGTRLFVDGSKRGFLPRVLSLRKPGPHVVRLEIPAFQPYELTISQTIHLHVGQQDIEAWTPVIVDCLSGEIFTASDSASIDPDRNSGTHSKTHIAAKAGGSPLLIVTTTDKRQAGWRKLGELKPAWANGAK